MKASLKNYRQSPRKARLVANTVKGKNVTHACAILSFLNKRAAHPIKNLILSATQNAKEKNKEVEDKNLIIKSIRVDDGIVLKRGRAGSRGTGKSIKKRTSNILIELETKKV